MPKKKRKELDRKEALIGNVYEFVAKIEDPDFHKRPCTKFNHGTIMRSIEEFIQRAGLESF